MQRFDQEVADRSLEINTARGQRRQDRSIHNEAKITSIVTIASAATRRINACTSTADVEM